MTADHLDARHRLAARILLRWPRQLNDLVEDTTFFAPFSWVALLGIAVLALLGAGIARLIEQLLAHPIEDIYFIGVFFGLATGCLIAGWMMLGLALAWHFKRVASTQALTPRVIRAQRMLAAAAVTPPADPEARRAR